MPPGVNFINILQSAFMCSDPESAKKTDGLTVFFVLLGSLCIKVARKMLVKLTPGGPQVDQVFGTIALIPDCY